MFLVPPPPPHPLHDPGWQIPNFFGQYLTLEVSELGKDFKLEPIGPLDFILHALRALRPCGITRANTITWANSIIEPNTRDKTLATLFQSGVPLSQDAQPAQS